MKSLLETLAILAMGALLAGCGGAPSPVNSAEVPAATEAKPSQSGGAASPAPTSTATPAAKAPAAPPH